MSKRGAAAHQGPSDGTVAEPPAAPLREAAAAAEAPNPPPPVDTSRGALERETSWLPAALQPAGVLLVGMTKAAWAVVLPLARIGYRLAVWSSPVLVWAFWKYINWYLLGWLTKAQRVLKWGAWVLSWFGKSGGAAAAA